ncbi:MAG: efflux RND transporter permease subunit [Syntrophotaleaceae bacterium]
MARYGLTVGDVQDIIQSAIGGMNVTQAVEVVERYPVNVRYLQDYRNDLPALKRVLIPIAEGKHIPIGQIADIRIHGVRAMPSRARTPGAPFGCRPDPQRDRRRYLREECPPGGG